MNAPARIWIGVALAAGILVPTAVAYGLGRSTATPGTRIACLDVTAVKTSASTSSTTWTNVPGMQIKDFLAQNMSLQLSGTFDGSQVQVRVLDTSVGGTSALAPRATAVPASSGTGFSFTWVGSFPAEHQHTFQLQWRLSSGGSASMSAGALTLLYEGAPTPTDCVMVSA
jgi:hypothetical protein